jgi:hypothetical protein
MKTIRLAGAYLAGGLVGGFLLSALWSDEVTVTGGQVPESDAALHHRITQVERRLESVVSANAQLEAELERIGDLLGSRAAEVPERSDAARSAPGIDDPGAEITDEPPSSQARSRFERMRRAREQGLAEQLTAAGFTEADARHIETRVEELRVAAMQSRYERLRGAEPDGASRSADGTATLRAELGDAQYERFLEATGRPTRVGVASVLSSSAAETAGILSGDAIVAYGGERVFDVRDLNRVLLEGEPGEPVVVDIVRDGQPIQIVMPRGPLGISSGFGRRGGG